MAVVLVISLILVVLHLDEIRVHGVRVEAERDQGVDGSRLGDDLESPGLLVLELDHVLVVADDFVALVFGVLEELGEGEPLAGWDLMLVAAAMFQGCGLGLTHLVAIVGVHKLVIVDAVRGVAFHALDGGLA